METDIGVIGILYVAYYVAFITGSLSMSIALPLAGLPLFMAAMYNICTAEILQIPMLYIVYLPLVVGAAGVTSALIAQLTTSDELLQDIDAPADDHTKDTRELVRATRVLGAIFLAGFCWIVRGVLGVFMPCAKSNLSPFVYVGAGGICCLFSLILVSLTRYQPTRVDFKLIFYYTLLQLPPLLYVLLDTTPTSMHSGLFIVFINGFAFVLTLVVAAESAWQVSARQPADRHAKWALQKAVGLRWYMGTGIPCLVTCCAGWAANQYLRVTNRALEPVRELEVRGLTVTAVLVLTSLVVLWFYSLDLQRGPPARLQK